MKIEDYIRGIKAGDRVILGQAITLVESTNNRDLVMAEEVVEKCIIHSGNSIRIAVSGSPGVGKSTFIEKFGQDYIKSGHKVAVLAIDPSSQLSGGSILGDKTRMEELSKEKNAFIRPSPASEFLGGVTNKTRETILLCEAAGFDRIIIETVGVGQSEVAAYRLSDFFLLLTLAGAGDDLQGIKRGIMELADCIVVNKADGDNIQRARGTRQQYANALHLMPTKDSGQEVPVLTASGLTGNGIPEIVSLIEEYTSATKTNGFWKKKREQQKVFWLNDAIQHQIDKKYKAFIGSKDNKDALIESINNGAEHPNKIARRLLGI